jgi:hypothetical protein
VAPEKEEREAGRAPSLLSVKSEDSVERQITETSVDLQCKFITGPEICNLQRLPVLENGAIPQEHKQRMSHRLAYGATLLEELLGEGHSSKPGLRNRIAFNRSCALSPWLITRSLVCKRGCHTPFRKHLQFIVMSVMVVTFPYTYRGFLRDGELMGCLVTVMPSSW